jgi:hypothetical protein
VGSTRPSSSTVRVVPGQPDALALGTTAESGDQRHEGTGHEHRDTAHVDDRAVEVHGVVSKRQTGPVQLGQEGPGDRPDLEGSNDRRRSAVEHMESPPAGRRWTFLYDDQEERIVLTIERHAMIGEDVVNPAGESVRGRSNLEALASEFEELRGHPPEAVEPLPS